MILTVICIILPIVLFFKLSKDKKPIMGVYEQKGRWFWFKQWFMYLAIKFNKRNANKSVGHAKAGYGLKAVSDVNTMESAQKLGEHPLSVDAVWFGGGNREGFYMVISGARRKLSVMQSMLFMYVPDLGLLQSTQAPETALSQTEEESKGWKGEGISLEPLEPLKKWKISFQGEMVHAEKGTRYQVNLDCFYNTDSKHFDFDSDMEPWTVARAMAREPWSREYFQRLRAAHQNHYEQFGRVTGNLSVDQVDYPVDIDVMKDHTHGSVRDWTLMHRYAFHQFTTTSGVRGFLGIVSQPGTLSYLELGWILVNNQAHPVQDVDFDIYNFGEGGEDPGDYGFRFRAGNVWYNVQVELKHKSRGRAFYGYEWEARIVERFCKYKINGDEGWGMSEWEYRHKGGRPSSAPGPRLPS